MVWIILFIIFLKKWIKNKVLLFKLIDENKGFFLFVIKFVFGEIFFYFICGKECSDVIKKRNLYLEGNLEENNLEKWFLEMFDDVIE